MLSERVYPERMLICISVFVCMLVIWRIFRSDRVKRTIARSDIADILNDAILIVQGDARCELLRLVAALSEDGLDVQRSFVFLIFSSLIFVW